MSESKSLPMFRMQPDDVPVLWPLRITVPTASGPVDMQFGGRFRLLDDDETKTESAKGDRHFIRKVLVGWGGDYGNLLNHDGSPMDFSADVLEALCDKAYFRRGVVSAYYLCAAGIVEKN